MISSDPSVQARYEAMVAAGESPRFAEMIATRSFPGVKGTDASFMQGRALDGAQFEGTPPIVGKAYVAKAKAAGVNPSGKFYQGTLARFPGDPQAWVSGLNDVKRICKERNWGCRGAINVATPEFDPAAESKTYTVAPDIVAKEVNKQLAARPELAKKKDELIHEVTKLRSGAKGPA